VKDILFWGLFPAGAILGIVSGVMDRIHYTDFQDQLKMMFDIYKKDLKTLKQDDITPKDCKKFLHELKIRLLCNKEENKEETAIVSEDPEKMKKDMKKNLYHFFKYLDKDDVKLLTVENINILLNKLDQIKQDEIINDENKKAIVITQKLIFDIIDANQRNIDAANAQIVINAISLVASLVFGSLEGYSGDTILPSNSCQSIADHFPTYNKINYYDIGMNILDCSFWAGCNYAFKKYLDAPLGRDDLIDKHITPLPNTKVPSKTEIYNEIEKYFNDHLGDIAGIKVEHPAPQPAAQPNSDSKKNANLYEKIGLLVEEEKDDQ